jgi:hypothetical protein
LYRLVRENHPISTNRLIERFTVLMDTSPTSFAMRFSLGQQ